MKSQKSNIAQFGLQDQPHTLFLKIITNNKWQNKSDMKIAQLDIAVFVIIQYYKKNN